MLYQYSVIPHYILMVRLWKADHSLYLITMLKMPARFSTRVTTYSCDRHGPIKTRDCYAVPSQKPGLCHTSADGLANETLCVTLTKGIFFIVQTETIVTSDDSTFFFCRHFQKTFANYESVERQRNPCSHHLPF